MNNDQGIPKIFSVLLLVAAATLGWFGLKGPGVPRVADNRTSAQVPADEQDVIARLWEDPLQAMQAELSKKARDKPSNTNQANAPSKHTIEAMQKAVIDKAGTNHLCLLVVPIPDTPFPDDFETRLRMRYSVQMALAAENFAPNNRKALGYFELPSPTNTDSSESKMYVPYEWFIPRSKAAANVVLVLWLPEGRLSSAPLDLLHQLQTNLQPVQSNEYPYVFVIGPRSSDTLKKMVPAQGETNTEKYSLMNKLSIFSPQATTPDPLIELAPQKTWAKARDDFASKLHETLIGYTNGFGTTDSWRYFHNFIAPDDQLTDLLVAELALREVVKLGVNSEDKILILAEADTQYGRSLPLAIQASLDSYRNSNIHYSINYAISSSHTTKWLQDNREKPPWEPKLMIYRYLRGLDQQKGNEGNAKAPARTGAKAPDEVLAEVFSKQGAMALGESQLDYVDRLGENLQRGATTGKIKAVGVLGGDLYDKLILLRTLRPKFPGAVFFTTDLDARMWNPEHLPFTRNVVVASAYGVEFVGQNDGEATQKADEPRIPPFRDGYQVAVYKACRAALQKAVNPATNIPLPLQPSIFELGWNGPIELKPLTVDSPAGGIATNKSTWIAAMKRGLPKPTLGQERGLYLCLGGGLLTLGLIIASQKAIALKEWLDTYRWIIGTVVASLMLICVFYIASRNFAELPGGERWEWRQGTSIWPTEMLRLIIICSVITAFIWAWQHYVKARKQLKEDYFLTTPKLPSQPDVDSKGNSAVALFQEYVKKAGRGKRALRVTLATIAYMLLASGMVYLVDGEMAPRPHIRGDVARNWDLALLFVSITCFLSLIFSVLDAVLISAELLSSLSGAGTVWPPGLIKKEQEKFEALDNDDLAGYLDVRFAAQKSEETRKLILIPFIIQW